MQSFDRPSDNHDVAKERYTLQRLTRLKGKIWALTLDQAEKYFQLAEFAKVEEEQEEEELQKIKCHLLRRIEKLTRRQMFEKTELQQKMRLQLLQRQMDRGRTSVIYNNSKISNSIITLREFENVLGNTRDLPTEQSLQLQEELINGKLPMPINQESESGTQPQRHQTYNDLYNNIAELKSTEYTEQGDFDMVESQYEQYEHPQEKMRIRKRVCLRYFRNLYDGFEKLVELKRIFFR